MRKAQLKDGDLITRLGRDIIANDICPMTF